MHPVMFTLKVLKDFLVRDLSPPDFLSIIWKQLQLSKLKSLEHCVTIKVLETLEKSGFLACLWSPRPSVTRTKKSYKKPFSGPDLLYRNRPTGSSSVCHEMSEKLWKPIISPVVLSQEQEIELTRAHIPFYEQRTHTQKSC